MQGTASGAPTVTGKGLGTVIEGKARRRLPRWPPRLLHCVTVAGVAAVLVSRPTTAAALPRSAPLPQPGLRHHHQQAVRHEGQAQAGHRLVQGQQRAQAGAVRRTACTGWRLKHAVC